MIKKILKNQKGLTLIELLAVIVILGIIAAIAVPAIGSVIEKTRLDAVKADAMQVLDAAKLAVASEGLPEDDSSFDSATNDLAGFVEGVDLASYKVIEDSDSGALKISFTTKKVNKNIYEVPATNPVSSEDLQAKNFFVGKEKASSTAGETETETETESGEIK